ncbi:MAG TPA: VOC family protein, partial [Flavobacteriales bacterium]|nr:VOC family protein [Flavobacteriales bacterium]
MQSRLSFITLGVADLDKSRAFYSDVLGWKPMHDANGIVMYKLNGFILSLYPQHELMEDAQVSGETRGARFTLAQCLNSPEEVEAFFVQLKNHGVSITKEPVKVF